MTHALNCRIVRLRGLPYEATEEDVVNFFDGFKVAAVHFTQRSGKPTGEAYVEFENAEVAREAMKSRQKYHIGTRYIEIFDAGEANLVAGASTPDNPEPSLTGFVVRLRGLPFSSTAEDVLTLFKPLEPVNEGQGILFTCTADGRATGEAFLEFSSDKDAQAALSKNNERLGSRYIEIFSSSKGELFQTASQKGLYTAVCGVRIYHPPLPPTVTAAPEKLDVATKASTSTPSRIRSGAGLPEEVVRSFSGMSLLHREQVSGRSPYLSPPQGQYMMGMHPGMQQMQGPGSSWVQVPLHPSSPQPLSFNPAPGPPGSRGGRHGSGSNVSPYNYNCQPVMTPFMLQHPFMGAQVPPWAQGPAGYMTPQQAQQAAAAAAGVQWYAGGQGGMRRVGAPGGGQYAPQGFNRGYYRPPQQAQQHPGLGRGQQQMRTMGPRNGGRGSSPRPSGSYTAHYPDQSELPLDSRSGPQHHSSTRDVAVRTEESLASVESSGTYIGGPASPGEVVDQ